ncbi:hypothetical protein D9757_009984 [Collybiopsis confluens]|uniref:Uncharacterized protein n=1 Tax=Collybiopsis confluens TaxID=2823264 RepID=A0A8H5GV21_9AGAR|nr:hypothetical protein D9757_009984 [Collybiopsis confluens]
MSNSSIEPSEPGQDARISLTISPTRIRRYLSQQTIKERQLTLLKSSPHPSLPISIINYTNDTEWHRQWDDLTMAARVLVIEPSTGTVVSRAFSKFFNWDERDAYRLPVPVVPVGGTSISSKRA